MTSPDAQARLNTDRELWREREGDFYADSIHVTKEGCIGMCVGGSVVVLPIRKWHALSRTPDAQPSSTARLKAGHRPRQLYEAEGSIHSGMKGAVSVAGAPDAADGRRTIAICPEWGDALEIAEALNARAPSSTDGWETCADCNGAGGDNQHTVCGKCGGAGGYPAQPSSTEGEVERVARAICWAFAQDTEDCHSACFRAGKCAAIKVDRSFIRDARAAIAAQVTKP